MEKKKTKQTNAPEPVSSPATVAVPAKTENEYTVSDLAGAARTRFEVPPEVVQAALKEAGKTSATQEDAEEIIKQFLNRGVK